MKKYFNYCLFKIHKNEFSADMEGFFFEQFFYKNKSFILNEYEYDEEKEETKKRYYKIYKFLLKFALNNLPPKQRKIFYSVWCNSGGDKRKGIMVYSRKNKENYITNYSNYNIAIKNLVILLKKKGYFQILEKYLEKGEDL